MDKTFMAGMQKQMTTQNRRKSRTLNKNKKKRKLIIIACLLQAVFVVSSRTYSPKTSVR